MTAKSHLSKSLQIKFLTEMLNIRLAEEKIVEVYQQQNMRTPTHLSIGQEAVAAGVCSALRAEDQVFTGHRCHAHFLAKGGNLDAFFAELCGRQTGANQGRIGSAHLTDESRHVYASPILGAMVPVAVGAALNFAMDRSKNIAVIFFGDAAIEEGVFAESLNFAVVKKLPVFFVCENNLYSTHSPLKVRQPKSPIFKRIRTPELNTQQIDGNDVEKVYRSAVKAVNHCRAQKGPAFIEYLTYRIREHVGPLLDYDKGYRSKGEVDAWIKKCPVKRYREKLIKRKSLTQQQFNAISEQIKKEVQKSYDSALNSPWPDPEKILEHVY